MGKRKESVSSKIEELLAKGFCTTEVSEMLGVTVKRINNEISRKHLKITDEQKERSAKEGKRKTAERAAQTSIATEQKYKETIARDHPEVEYVGGYTGTNGTVIVRCKKCGAERTVGCSSIRGGFWPECKSCAEILKKARKENTRLHNLFINEALKGKQMEIRTCKLCGKIFQRSGKYCSEECARKALNRKKEKRIQKAANIDKSITLEKLYSRDKGTCYICGCRCDWKDFQILDGAYIVGGSYPTIEHVIPLSRGGDHTWENVRLACHSCNTKKGSRIFEEYTSPS